MSDIFEIPESIEQLFSRGETNYRIISNDKGRDNIESLQWFLELIGATEWNIVEDLGTQVTIRHMDYPQHMVINSGGLGDFYSHGFDVTEYNFG
jgi:hypothetical protein